MPFMGTPVIDRVVDLSLNDRAHTRVRDLIRTI
jgi:hypothetical protein